MIRETLFKPVFLNKQINDIAKETGLSINEVMDICNARLFVEERSVRLIRPDDILPGETIISGSEALKVLGAKQTPVSEIEIPYQLFDLMHPKAWYDICYFCSRIVRINERYRELSKFGACNMLKWSEERMLFNAVNLLESNNAGVNKACARRQDGCARRSLNDVGYSLLTGWNEDMLKHMQSEEAHHEG